jgi:Pregnancy-associated plasma protein-A
MCRLAILFFSIFISLLANAQTSDHSRCEFQKMEDTGRFEQWLNSKQAQSTIRKQTLIYRIPVVVHVLHLGEPIGEGYNHSIERVRGQIRTLNEDFRRKEGTPGFNSHPDGGDAHIEFVLAETAPDGNPTNGIVRVELIPANLKPGPDGDIVTLCSRYSNWDPNQYLNIWSFPFDFPTPILLGKARFPITDLPGLEDIQNPAGEGVFIDALVFGQGDVTAPNYNKGRTLTHEIGHFLGLLHTFGSVNNSQQCDAYTDHCNDTPPIPVATMGCPSVKPAACDGRPVMVENYMDGSYDECMNIFTRNQISRMHTVLENSPLRKTLLTSPVINRDITGVDDDLDRMIKVYPNPAKDKIYLSADNELQGYDVHVTAFDLLGKELFTRSFKLNGDEIEIPVPDVHEEMIILLVKAPDVLIRKLIMVD